MNNKKPFGLDIGAFTIKVVSLDRQAGGFLLRSATSVPAPSKGMLSGSPLDEEEMVQTIKKAVISTGITSKFVNIALPENQVYTKVLDMPVLSDRELRSAIYWEAEQYIPVSLSNISLVWSIISRPAQNVPEEKMQVLMVGAPNVLISKYQKILNMAGFTIVAMETEILSIVRALAGAANFPPTIILNIGAVCTSIAIVVNGSVVFTYSMSIGGAAVTRAIASDFGFTPIQAEEYKKAYGVSGQSLGGKIGKSTEPILNSILTEVKKSQAFYSQKYKDSPIRQVLLSGGTAKLPGIDAFFAQNLGIESVIANPWKSIASAQIPKDLVDSAPDYSVAVGLALRDYE